MDALWRVVDAPQWDRDVALMLAANLFTSILLAGLLAVVTWIFEPLVGAPRAWRRALVRRLGVRGHVARPRLLPAETELDQVPQKIDLSVLIVVRNEEARVSVVLDDILSHLSRGDKTFEVLVVDNASTDRSAPAVLRFTKRAQVQQVRLLRLFTIHAEGDAFRQGLAYTRGNMILRTGPKGFVGIEELERLTETVNESSSPDVIVLGSRAHLQIEIEHSVSRLTPAQRMWKIFVGLFQATCVESVFDPVCPFQMYSRSAAQTLFLKAHLSSEAVFCEVLKLAKMSKRFVIRERAVTWDAPVSSSPSFWQSLQLCRDIVMLQFAHGIGLWRR